LFRISIAAPLIASRIFAKMFAQDWSAEKLNAVAGGKGCIADFEQHWSEERGQAEGKRTTPSDIFATQIQTLSLGPAPPSPVEDARAPVGEPHPFNSTCEEG
jgi:hypothetical protein